MERTLVIIKPDATARNLSRAIINRFEEDGFEITGLKVTHFDLLLAKQFYSQHAQRPGFLDYVRFMSSGMLVCVVFKREDAIARARELVGSWDPARAVSGTIRADFGIPDEKGILNVVHASDSPESVQKEISLIFGRLEDVFESLYRKEVELINERLK